MNSIIFFLLFVCSVNAALSGCDGGAPLESGDSAMCEVLKIHNIDRNSVSPPAQTPLVNLQWDANLAQQALSYAQACEYGHSSSASRKDVTGENGQNFWHVGENLAIGYPTVDYGGTYDHTTGLTGWWNEKQDYDITANTCTPGKPCGHYTQMAWEDTHYIGCGYHVCASVDMTAYQSGIWNNAGYLVCNYGVGGNVNGARPYVVQTGPTPAPTTPPPTPATPAPTPPPAGTACTTTNGQACDPIGAVFYGNQCFNYANNLYCVTEVTGDCYVSPGCSLQFGSCSATSCPGDYYQGAVTGSSDIGANKDKKVDIVIGPPAKPYPEVSNAQQATFAISNLLVIALLASLSLL